MRRVAGSWRDVGSDLPNEIQLSSGRVRQQRRHHIFEGDDAYLQLHELCVRQRQHFKRWLP